MINSHAAIKIIGNQPVTAVRNMVVALCLMPRMNTPEEWTRLKAGVVWLKSQHHRVPKVATQTLKEFCK